MNNTLSTTILPIFSILFIATATQHAIAQEESIVFRDEEPFGIKLSTEGSGVDFSYGPVGVDLTTFLVYNAAKARFIILSSNASPFVGVGVGERSKGASGGSDS